MLPPRATGPRLTECLSLIQKRPRASQGAAVRSVAASPAVLPRGAEDFEVVVAMRVITGDGLELHGRGASRGARRSCQSARLAADRRFTQMSLGSHFIFHRRARAFYLLAFVFQKRQRWSSNQPSGKEIRWLPNLHNLMHLITWQSDDTWPVLRRARS